MVVAAAALFVALGGTGWAATHSGSAARPVAHAAGAPTVKVRCSAKRNGKKVSCSVVKGSGVGPTGPRGLQGPPGTPASTGPTTLSEQPGFVLTSGSPPMQLANTSGKTYDGGEEQEFSIYNSLFSAVGPFPGTLVAPLLSPSSITGGASSLTSVEFCWGEFDDTDPPANPSTLRITDASVYEYDEPTASGTSPPAASPTDTTPEAAPYAATKLLDASGLSLGAGYGCQTIQASSPPAITAGGYMSLVLTISFSAHAASGNYPESTLSLGRVTATYGS
jgi:hypothetical protein